MAEGDDSDLVALFEIEEELKKSVADDDGVWTQADVDKVSTYIKNYQSQQGRIDAGKYFVEKQAEFLRRYFPRLGGPNDHVELKAYFCSRHYKTTETANMLSKEQEDQRKRFLAELKC
jgi:hypothetical protein